MICDYGRLGLGFLRLPHIAPDGSRDADPDIAASCSDSVQHFAIQYHISPDP